jgi:hypothetical protein
MSVVCAVFQYFDNDGSGTIDYDEFLVGVRGELNERRKALVQLASNFNNRCLCFVQSFFTDCGHVGAGVQRG